jgi:transcriptional regulator with XRE-family HTH domain
MMPPRDLVRSARRLADLSQRQLAERAGVSPGTVAKIETGEREPSLKLLLALLDAAGCSLRVVPRSGDELPVLRDDDMRDAARRRFPAHLDVYYFRGVRFQPLQPSTARGRFFRDRQVRDVRRAMGRQDPRIVDP